MIAKASCVHLSGVINYEHVSCALTTISIVLNTESYLKILIESTIKRVSLLLPPLSRLLSRRRTSTKKKILSLPRGSDGK